MIEPPPHDQDPAAPSAPAAEQQRVLLVAAVDAYLVGHGVPVLCRTVERDTVVVRLHEPDEQRRTRTTEYGPTTAEIHTGHLVDDGRATRLDITRETADAVLSGRACTVEDEHGDPVVLRLPTGDEFHMMRAYDNPDHPASEEEVRLATTALLGDGSDDDARTAAGLEAAHRREIAVEIYCTRLYLRNQLLGQVVTGLDRACRTTRRWLRTHEQAPDGPSDRDLGVVADLESARRMITGLVLRLTSGGDGPVPAGASQVPDQAADDRSTSPSDVGAPAAALSSPAD